MARLGRAPNNRTNVWTTVVWTTLEERRLSAVITAISQNLVISTESGASATASGETCCSASATPGKATTSVLESAQILDGAALPALRSELATTPAPAAKRRKNAAQLLAAKSNLYGQL